MHIKLYPKIPLVYLAMKQLNGYDLHRIHIPAVLYILLLSTLGRVNSDFELSVTTGLCGDNSVLAPPN